jgi:hypothetical protein
MSKKCDGCGKSFDNLIAVSDHPYTHNGNYCEDCNPYEQDRREAQPALRDVVVCGACESWQRIKFFPTMGFCLSMWERIPIPNRTLFLTSDEWYCADGKRKGRHRTAIRKNLT